MRWVSLILISLLLLVQYPLWFGKGGWLKVWDLDRQVEEQKHINQKTQTRNAVLDAEVRDLKQGTEAREERARSELGMVKRDEVFFQIVGDAFVIVCVSGARDVEAASGVLLK
ncbi:MAG: cell division protein FtsB [Nitrosomonadales bacterium]|nr:cell division protein FtsB [Nitrosomonadales bacterium]